MWTLHLAYAFSGAMGYVAEKGLFLAYLHRHTATFEPILEKLPSTVALLQSMQVHEDHQGKGLGKIVLANFEEKATEIGADAVFLIADVNEIQRENFDLVNFYKKNGYRKIASTSSGPVMMKKLD